MVAVAVTPVAADLLDLHTVLLAAAVEVLVFSAKALVAAGAAMAATAVKVVLVVQMGLQKALVVIHHLEELTAVVVEAVENVELGMVAKVA